MLSVTDDQNSSADHDTTVIQTKVNRATKTFASRKVVFKYAMFISKDFYESVVSAFDSMSVGDVEEAQRIVSETVITPEMIATHDQTQKKMVDLIAEKVGSKPYHFSNYHNLVAKTITGYTAKQLTDGNATVKDWIYLKEHQGAMLGKIATMQLVINCLVGGLDYHSTAMILGVETGKNKSILKQTQT